MFTTSEEFKETYETDMLENIEKTVDLQKQRAGNVGSMELSFAKNVSEFRNLVR